MPYTKKTLRSMTRLQRLIAEAQTDAWSIQRRLRRLVELVGEAERELEARRKRDAA